MIEASFNQPVSAARAPNIGMFGSGRPRWRRAISVAGTVAITRSASRDSGPPVTSSSGLRTLLISRNPRGPIPCSTSTTWITLASTTTTASGLAIGSCGTNRAVVDPTERSDRRTAALGAEAGERLGVLAFREGRD